MPAGIVLGAGTAIAQGPAVTEDGTGREGAGIGEHEIGTDTGAVRTAAEVGCRARLHGYRLRRRIAAAEAVACDHAYGVAAGIGIAALNAAACV